MEITMHFTHPSNWRFLDGNFDMRPRKDHELEAALRRDRRNRAKSIHAGQKF